MSTRTVLVVDDDDSIRMVAEVALETVGGWSVLSVDGGARAVELAASAPADGVHLDAVLLDVMMPGMDGIATFRALQADPRSRDVPVILVTAKFGMDETPIWDGLAVAGVIAKPFDPMTLAADVAGLLGWE